ncbi:hypothetical protein [Thermococcus sp.]|uniref:hypothetical protein n=1 Tax=Thermococcus sp. TaxID=35749 RepID=UPI0025E8300E|nr:hypothetical protein [Thermococcus sp.]
MDVSPAGIYLILTAVIPIFYAEWTGWPGDIIKKVEPPIYELEEAIERSFKYMVSMTFGLILISMGMTIVVPWIGYVWWAITGIVVLWLRHGREQLKLKLQEARMKEAVAKGVEIGMKKAKEV